MNQNIKINILEILRECGTVGGFRSEVLPISTNPLQRRVSIYCLCGREILFSTGHSGSPLARVSATSELDLDIDLHPTNALPLSLSH